jgi:hypothetical protein
LPPAAIAALNAIEVDNTYYFWRGESTEKACVGNYQRAFSTGIRIVGAIRLQWNCSYPE